MCLSVRTFPKPKIQFPHNAILATHAKDTSLTWMIKLLSLRLAGGDVHEVLSNMKKALLSFSAPRLFPEIFPFSHWGCLKKSTANLRKRPKVSDFLAQFFSDPKNDLPASKMVDAFALASHCLPLYVLISFLFPLNQPQAPFCIVIQWDELCFKRSCSFEIQSIHTLICSISFFPPLSPWSRCFLLAKKTSNHICKGARLLRGSSE